MGLRYKQGFILTAVLVLLLLNVNAQKTKVDSLQQAVEDYRRDDSTRVNKLLALARAIPNNEMERAETIFNQALDLSSKIG
jgi:predicted Holliday junction resolvase-like endonuclease